MKLMKYEEEISRMLASLKGVDAPENFEGAVRSRIAESRDARSRSKLSLVLVAKFALPLLLLLTVGGFLIVSDDRSLNVEMVPPVSDEAYEVTAIDASLSDEPGTSATNTVNSRIAHLPANRSGGDPRPVLKGGSEDIGLSTDDTTVFPDGLDPRNAKAMNIEPPTGRGLSPISLLSMMGILSACAPQSCQVRYVKDSSLAQKAGVRVGDVVKKIGDRPLDSFHSTSFEVNSIEIVRDGKPTTISIRFP